MFELIGRASRILISIMILLGGVGAAIHGAEEGELEMVLEGTAFASLSAAYFYALNPDIPNTPRWVLPLTVTAVCTLLVIRLS